MPLPVFYPYRSEAARDACFAYLDALATRTWPIASEDRLVPTTWGATFVRISGPRDGPPLVLLHGAGGTSLMWAPNIQDLSARCRVIAVDQLGEFGKSSCTRRIQSLDDIVDWLDQLFDALQLHSGVHLVGMSYGGALAAQYALRFPARLAKLILLAPGATVLRPPVEFWARITVALFARRRGFAAFMRWIFPDLARQDPQFVDGAAEQVLLGMDSLERHITPIPPVLTDAEWARLAVPTLFLVGEHERIYRAEKAVGRLRRVAPAVTAEIVPNAGHDLSIIQAAAIDRHILGFVHGNTAAATLA
jgi:pimeloyl-ACP methyl ester carboxylesterase